MNKKYLLSSVTAGIALLYANQGTAQCLTKQDCAALGYTETSCSNGGIKCPFGNTWSCTPPCGTAYKYTCSGTGYAGGSGSACGGKYTQCKCASGYEWKDGSCQKEVLNGAQGELYYCNGTVVGVKASGMDFYVAMEDLGKITWISANSQCQNYVFCEDARGILPTKNQLSSIYNEKSSINTLLTANAGTQLTGDYYWSSTDFNTDFYYTVNMSNGKLGDGYAFEYNPDYRYARPILTSW